MKESNNPAVTRVLKKEVKEGGGGRRLFFQAEPRVQDQKIVPKKRSKASFLNIL